MKLNLKLEFKKKVFRDNHSQFETNSAIYVK